MKLRQGMEISVHGGLIMCGKGAGLRFVVGPDLMGQVELGSVELIRGASCAILGT